MKAKSKFAAIRLAAWGFLSLVLSGATALASPSTGGYELYSLPSENDSQFNPGQSLALIYSYDAEDPFAFYAELRFCSGTFKKPGHWTPDEILAAVHDRCPSGSVIATGRADAFLRSLYFPFRWTNATEDSVEYQSLNGLLLTNVDQRGSFELRGNPHTTTRIGSTSSTRAHPELRMTYERVVGMKTSDLPALPSVEVIR